MTQRLARGNSEYLLAAGLLERLRPGDEMGIPRIFGVHSRAKGRARGGLWIALSHFSRGIVGVGGTSPVITPVVSGTTGKRQGS